CITPSRALTPASWAAETRLAAFFDICSVSRSSVPSALTTAAKCTMWVRALQSISDTGSGGFPKGHRYPTLHGAGAVVSERAVEGHWVMRTAVRKPAVTTARNVMRLDRMRMRVYPLEIASALR